MDSNHVDQTVPGGVPLEDEAKRQQMSAAHLPIVFKHIAAMPDVHFGIGATVGSVIATQRAIIPAAVGVEIGRGMMAAKTTLKAKDLPDNLGPLRSSIERAVPHGRSAGRAPGARDTGAWGKVPGSVDTAWAQLEPGFTELCRDQPRLEKTNNRAHLGTLGSGNHFIEVCLDEAGSVWFMLHSGSRGVGNAIGTMFIELARQNALRHNMTLPDRDLEYFEEGARHFGDYMRALGWAQSFAALNREVTMKHVIDAAKAVIHKNFAKLHPSGELPPQLGAAGTPLRRVRLRHAPARGACRCRAAGHHSRQHGRAQLHRARQGQCAVVRVVLARRRPRDEPRRSEAPLHARRSPCRDRRRRARRLALRRTRRRLHSFC